MAGDPRTQYIIQQANARGLDPNAVLAIGGHEGLSGGIGDGGHAFGPWQMNNAGGVLTGKFKGMTPQQINAWAWSNQGINYALDGLAKVAGGLKGRAAINAITTRFERPADPNAEINDAWARYGHSGAAGTPGGGISGGAVSPSAATGGGIDAGGSMTRQQLVQQVFGGANKIDFGSNQVQAPNLMAAMQLRKLNATGQGTATGVPVKVATAQVGGTGVGASIAKTALTQLGQRYQYGGQAKLGTPTDCSGLLQESARAHGISIPRTTYDQWRVGTPIPPTHLQAGDAVFFKGSDAHGDLPGHVGIYIGHGKFVEDPHTGGTVSISTLAGRSDFVGARRFG